MQLITFSPVDSSKSLYNLCISNGIKVRSKIAKSNYIAALETFNANAIEAAKVAAEMATPVIEAIAIVLTVTAYAGCQAGKAARTHKVFPRLLSACLYALGCFLHSVHYVRTTDRYDVAADLFTMVENLAAQDHIIDIEPVISATRAKVATIAATIAHNAPTKADVLSYIIAAEVAYNRHMVTLQRNGEVWAESQGA